MGFPHMIYSMSPWISGVFKHWPRKLKTASAEIMTLSFLDVFYKTIHFALWFNVRGLVVIFTAWDRPLFPLNMLNVFSVLLLSRFNSNYVNLIVVNLPFTQYVSGSDQPAKHSIDPSRLHVKCPFLSSLGIHAWLHCWPKYVSSHTTLYSYFNSVFCVLYVSVVHDVSTCTERCVARRDIRSLGLPEIKKVIMYLQIIMDVQKYVCKFNKDTLM